MLLFQNKHIIRFASTAAYGTKGRRIKITCKPSSTPLT